MSSVGGRRERPGRGAAVVALQGRARGRASRAVAPGACRGLGLDLRQGRYRLRFATTEEDRDQVFRLRFEVFNLELGEGLAGSFRTCRDRDRFDEHCQHLLVEDVCTARVVGTYRMQLPEVARQAAGLYVETEFDLSGIPSRVLERSVELGRACIAKEHRNRKVLFLLWRGLSAYVDRHDRRFLFGCSSLTTQDPREGLGLARDLEARGHRHPELVVLPRAGFECVSDASAEDLPSVPVPPLFGTYLRFGAKVLGPPALDREFGTIDFLTLLDVDAMDPADRGLFT